jgi:hypothetical protein
MRGLPAFLAVVVLLLPLPALAQGAPAAFPTATTLDALTTYPNFYHLKSIVVRGEVSAKDGQARLVPPGGAGRGVDLLLRGGDAPGSGPVEVRGQFWDVGRLSADDPHTAAYKLPDLVHARMGDRWPAHGEMLAINASSVSPAPPPAPRPSLRQLSLDPDRYDDQTVTVKGQFAGRNILGDLPQAPRISRTDFVIRNAGGAVWVAGIAPRGKGWQLNPESKLDTDQWLQVQGVVHHGDGLVWIVAKSVSESKADAEEAEPQAAAPMVLPPPPPVVIFTLPAQDDTDVPAASGVRIQTSRDLDPATFDKHVLVSYVGQAPAATPIAFKAAFDRGNRVLELTFDRPLERFRTVKVELLEGIKGTDGQPLKPFTLTFSIGG